MVVSGIELAEIVKMELGGMIDAEMVLAEVVLPEVVLARIVAMTTMTGKEGRETERRGK